MSFKYCVVPCCKNTTSQTPGKLFFHVPKDAKKRAKWCQIMRRNPFESIRSNRYVCEDHFELEEDVQDWMRYKILKDMGQKTFELRLKANILPHKFDCQKERHLAHPIVKDRSYISKMKELKTRMHVKDLLEAGPSNEIELANNSMQSLECSTELASSGNDTTMSIEGEESSKVKKAKIHYRSKGVQVGVKMKSITTSPMKEKKKRKKEIVFLDSDDLSDFLEDESVADQDLLDKSYDADADMINLDDSFDSVEGDGAKQDDETFRRLNINMMLKHSKQFFGLDSNNLFVIDKLEQLTKCPRLNIYITLRKIRLHETTEMLGIIFSLNKSTISRIISKTIPTLSSPLGTLIYWAPREVIRANLPLAFRANYVYVQSIIDCFEIEIQKPSKPSHQALSWSEYKKCNTVKYFVSCTPDGFINFVSKGYGGRTSDMEIVKSSGYIEKLPEGSHVLADRGFKQLETLLSQKKCSLLRPPSVSQDCKMTPSEGRQTKIIASLRVHIERVIKRLREYAFLDAHSRFHHDFLSLIDHIVIIAASLSNLQGPLLKI